MSRIRPSLGRYGALALAAVVTAGCGRGAAPAAEPAATATAAEPKTSVQLSEADASTAGIETAPARIVERVEPL